MTFLYSPGLTDTFVFDDIANLMPLESLTPGGEAQLVFGNGSGLLGRPLSMASFVLDWRLSGFDISAFKRTNLIIHLLCGVLVFALSRRLLALSGVTIPKARWGALWIAALWLLTPMAVSSVLFTVQRMAQLAALFLLAGMLCYIVGRQALVAGRRGGWWGIAAAVLICLPAAILSKENGALLPLLLLVVEWSFFRLEGVGRTRGVLVALFGVTLALPAVVVGVLLLSGWGLGGYGFRDFTLVERLMSEARALWDYALHWLWPLAGGYGIYHDDFPISRDLLSPPTTLAAVLGLGAVAVVVWRFRAPVHRPLHFGPLLFLAGHAMESTIFPLELYFEHRNYLPGFGLAFVVGLGLLRLLERAEVAPHGRGVMVAMVITLYLHGTASAGVIQHWRHPQMLAWFSSEYHPNSPRLLLDLADVRASEGRAERARELLRRVGELQPAYRPAVALGGLSVACFVGDSPTESWVVWLEQAFAAPEAARRPATLAAMVKLHQLVEFRRHGNGCPGLDLQRLYATLEPWVARIEDDPGLVHLIRSEMRKLFSPL